MDSQLLARELDRWPKSWVSFVLIYFKKIVCIKMFGVLFISLVNNDFQINNCTILLHMDERLCYALSILSIIYLP